jgi:hypothetical protein
MLPLSWDSETYLISNLDGVTSPTRQKHTVTSLDCSWDNVALLVRSTGTNGNDGGLRERGRSGRGREKDASGSFLVEH